MRFHPFHMLGSKKNIIVDGAAQEATVVVLSHWPASSTPDEWLRDTSTEIALDYLDRGQMPDDVEWVSNNHFDEDGLFGIYALIDPHFALANRDRFVDIAAAGDFGRCRMRDSARVIFAIPKLVAEIQDQSDYAARTAGIYETLIPMVPRLIDDVGQFEQAWRDEDRFLTECEKWLDRGVVRIEEDEPRDLAIVHIPDDLPDRSYTHFSYGATGPLHKMSLHSRTNRARVLFRQGHRYWFRFRYETWVKFVSESHPRRVDLTPLCGELSALEQDGAIWTYDGSSTITPVMRPDGPGLSSLDFDLVLEHLCRHLDEGTVDWDPFKAANSDHW